MDEPYIRFDRAKLKAATHYICSRMAPHELGNVKLHKILYFADMLKFMDTGSPLTGVDYTKQQFGPTARHLSAILDDLAAEGAIRIERRAYYGFEKKDYISLVEPDRTLLGNQDVELLDDVIAYARGRTATELSELSHDEAWRAADIGERIPYAAAIGWQPAEYTEADFKFAMDEARRLRPAIDKVRNASGVH